jgi:hypothetical protein
LNTPDDRAPASLSGSPEQRVEMTGQEKFAFWALHILAVLPALVLLVFLWYLWWRFNELHRPWPGGQSFLWMIAGVVFLMILVPAAVLFMLVRRRIKTASFLPSGVELERFRARHEEPRTLSRRVLYAVFYLAETVLFALNAMHRNHEVFGWWVAGLFAVGALFSVVQIFRPSGMAARRARAPRREGFACPSCGQSPPIGNWWACTNCKKSFDTFASSATCPNCGTWFSTTSCGNCKASHPMSEWATAAAARAGKPVP